MELISPQSFEKQAGIVLAGEGAPGRGRSWNKSLGVSCSRKGLEWGHGGPGAWPVLLGGCGCTPRLMRLPLPSGDLRAALCVDCGQDQRSNLQASLPGSDELSAVHWPPGHLWVRELCCEQVPHGLCPVGIFFYNMGLSVKSLPLNYISLAPSTLCQAVGKFDSRHPVGPFPLLPCPLQSLGQLRPAGVVE